MEAMFDNWLLQVSNYMPRLVAAIGLLILSVFAAKLARRMVQKVGCAVNLDKSVLSVFSRFSYVLILILGIFTSLGTAGINITPLVAGLGLGGFALGFALRDALSNLLSGILILIYRPFRLKETIAVAGFEGVIVEINLRYTVLSANEKRILIPNSTMFSNAVSILQKEPEH